MINVQYTVSVLTFQDTVQLPLSLSQSSRWQHCELSFVMFPHITVTMTENTANPKQEAQSSFFGGTWLISIVLANVHLKMTGTPFNNIRPNDAGLLNSHLYRV